MPRLKIANLCFLLFLAALCVTPARANDAERDAREERCIANGWSRLVMNVGGLQRRLMWKAPKERWPHGAIIVMHGGGGYADHWCFASLDLFTAQVEFTEAAVAEGFAVFTLDSTDQVSDREGRACGKVWDDEVQNRPNLDLPFLERLMRETIPRLRPAGSDSGVFLTGLSSGGYMTVRAATRFDALVSAFAPVSNGDPYGWHRVCDKSLTMRRTVFGVGIDNETGRRISDENSCLAPSYPNELPWDSQNPVQKPAFKLFHHEKDGVNDFSCSEKVARQLGAHGYPDAGAFVIREDGRHRLVYHFWQKEYTRPMLEFFKTHTR